jgi:HEPN domain-containing protein
LAILSLEQALQLYLKAKLLAGGIAYPRTHSVRKLLEMLAQVAPENKRAAIKKIPDKYTLAIGMLENAYVASRYVVRDFTKREAEKLTAAVEEIMKNVG